MARPGIPKEAVFETAQALFDANQRKPTPNEIRAQTKFGSFSTITAYLDEWWAIEQHASTQQIPEMPEPVDAAVKRLWAEAWRSAQKIIDAERQALELRRREIEQQSKDQLTEIERLENQLEQTETRAADAEKRLEAEQKAGEAAKKQAQDLKVENARLDERCASLIRETKSQQAEVKRLLKLADELEALRTNAESLRLENARLEEQLVACKEQVSKRQAQIR